jgi:hypothetical protein
MGLPTPGELSACIWSMSSGGNGEEDVPQGGNNGFLFGDVMSLALECELWKMVDLGEKI